MTTFSWEESIPGEIPIVELTDLQIKSIRQMLTQQGFDQASDGVRDHYSPRRLHPETYIAYEGDNPAVLALEVAAQLAADELAEKYPDHAPSEDEDTFGAHLALLRHHLQRLGPLQRDQLMNDSVWFWDNLVCETEQTREELVRDIYAQVEADMESKFEAMMKQGFERGWAAAQQQRIKEI